MRQILTLQHRLGSVIRTLIEDTGRTVVALAEGAGVPRATLYRKLDGHQSFTVDELVRIADYLDSTPGDLIKAAESLPAEASAPVAPTETAVAS